MDITQAKEIAGYYMEYFSQVLWEKTPEDSVFIKYIEDLVSEAEDAVSFGNAGTKTQDFVSYARQVLGQDSLNIAEKERLPLPTFVHVDALPEMPADLTSCSDEDIRRLHSQFHAYQVRTNWLCGLQENKVNEAKYNYKLAYDREMLRIDPFFREGNRAPKEKTKSYIEAEIMQNNAVVRLKEILVKLEADLSELKTLADIYEANVTRLSRESSMRYAERG